MRTAHTSPLPSSARMFLWLVSVLVAVTLFSLYFFRSGSVPFIFAVTSIFAFPVGFLYLPVVLALKDADRERLWILLLTGIAIGPAALALWGLFLELRGENAWQGDGLGLGILPCMLCAIIVGSLCSVLYVLALKLLPHLLPEPKSN